MADEDIVVNIDDDTQASLPLDADGAKLDPAIEDLKKQHEEMLARDKVREEQLRASRERETEARRIADDARKEAETARTEVVDSQADSIASGIAAAQAEAESAEREYKEAFEAGNAALMAAAQRKIARAEARAVRLDEAKADLEARKAAPAVERKEPQRPVQDVQADPVEAYISGPIDANGTRRTETTQNWLRAHKDWITDPKKNARLTSAHWDAVSKDLTPDTTEYFEHIETAIGLKQAPKTNGAAKPSVQRRPSVPVAPVQQSGGGTNGGSNEVRLTKGEAERATDGTLVWNYDDTSPQKRFKKGDPIGIQEMARRKQALQRQGAYDKSYTEA